MNKEQRIAYNDGFKAGYTKAIQNSTTGNTVTCTACGNQVVKKLLKFMVRKLKNTQCKRSVFVDETGRQFNGRQCPDCKYGKGRQASV